MSLQESLTRMIMSLPSGVIQAMAGRKIESNGNVLDPHIALMAKEAAKRPSMVRLLGALVAFEAQRGFRFKKFQRGSGPGIRMAPAARLRRISGPPRWPDRH